MNCALKPSTALESEPFADQQIDQVRRDRLLADRHLHGAGRLGEGRAGGQCQRGATASLA